MGLWNMGLGMAPYAAGQPAPKPAAPQSGGSGLWNAMDGSGPDKFNDVLSNPLFQFGIGIMGAGAQGQGLGGGLLAGSQNASKAVDFAKQQRELQAMKQRDAFIQSLGDPNNPVTKAFPPGTAAALQGLPPDQSAALLGQLLGKRNDLDTAKAIANINAQAQVSAKNAELKYQRDYDLQNTQRILDTLKTQAPPAGQSSAGEAPLPGARPAPDGNWYLPDPNRPGKYLMVKP